MFRETKMEQQERILDGDLETLGLQATLKMLALGGKTGILNVTSGQEHLHIALQGGHILGLDEPGAMPVDLVEIFRLLGRLDRETAAQLRHMSGNNPATAMMLMAQRRLMPPDEVQKRI